MKILFDAAQAYQLDAINAVVKVFAGQARADSTRMPLDSCLYSGVLWSETGIGNAFTLSAAAVLQNVREVQTTNALPLSVALAAINANVAHPEPNEADAPAHEAAAAFPNFSIEMETGTGKTYVYLRTILTLANPSPPRGLPRDFILRALSNPR